MIFTPGPGKLAFILWGATSLFAAPKKKEKKEKVEKEKASPESPVAKLEVERKYIVSHYTKEKAQSTVKTLNATKTQREKIDDKKVLAVIEAINNGNISAVGAAGCVRATHRAEGKTTVSIANNDRAWQAIQLMFTRLGETPPTEKEINYAMLKEVISRPGGYYEKVIADLEGLKGKDKYSSEELIYIRIFARLLERVGIKLDTKKKKTKEVVAILLQALKEKRNQSPERKFTLMRIGLAAKMMSREPKQAEGEKIFIEVYRKLGYLAEGKLSFKVSGVEEDSYGVKIDLRKQLVVTKRQSNAIGKFEGQKEVGLTVEHLQTFEVICGILVGEKILPSEAMKNPREALITFLKENKISLDAGFFDYIENLTGQKKLDYKRTVKTLKDVGLLAETVSVYRQNIESLVIYAKYYDANIKRVYVRGEAAKKEIISRFKQEGLDTKGLTFEIDENRFQGVSDDVLYIVDLGLNEQEADVVISIACEQLNKILYPDKYSPNKPEFRALNVETYRLLVENPATSLRLRKEVFHYLDEARKQTGQKGVSFYEVQGQGPFSMVDPAKMKAEGAVLYASTIESWKAEDKEKADKMRRSEDYELVIGFELKKGKLGEASATARWTELGFAPAVSPDGSIRVVPFNRKKSEEIQKTLGAKIAPDARLRYVQELLARMGIISKQDVTGVLNEKTVLALATLRYTPAYQWFFKESKKDTAMTPAQKAHIADYVRYLEKELKGFDKEKEKKVLDLVNMIIWAEGGKFRDRASAERLLDNYEKLEGKRSEIKRLMDFLEGKGEFEGIDKEAYLSNPDNINILKALHKTYKFLMGLDLSPKKEEREKELETLLYIFQETDAATFKHAEKICRKHLKTMGQGDEEGAVAYAIFARMPTQLVIDRRFISMLEGEAGKGAAAAYQKADISFGDAVTFSKAGQKVFEVLKKKVGKVDVGTYLLVLLEIFKDDLSLDMTKRLQKGLLGEEYDEAIKVLQSDVRRFIDVLNQDIAPDKLKNVYSLYLKAKARSQKPNSLVFGRYRAAVQLVKGGFGHFSVYLNRPKPVNTSYSTNRARIERYQGIMLYYQDRCALINRYLLNKSNLAGAGQIMYQAMDVTAGYLDPQAILQLANSFGSDNNPNTILLGDRYVHNLTEEDEKFIDGFRHVYVWKKIKYSQAELDLLAKIYDPPDSVWKVKLNQEEGKRLTALTKKIEEVKSDYDQTVNALEKVLSEQKLTETGRSLLYKYLEDLKDAYAEMKGTADPEDLEKMVLKIRALENVIQAYDTREKKEVTVEGRGAKYVKYRYAELGTLSDEAKGCLEALKIEARQKKKYWLRVEEVLIKAKEKGEVSTVDLELVGSEEVLGYFDKPEEQRILQKVRKASDSEFRHVEITAEEKGDLQVVFNKLDTLAKSLSPQDKLYGEVRLAITVLGKVRDGKVISKKEQEAVKKVFASLKEKAKNRFGAGTARSRALNRIAHNHGSAQFTKEEFEELENLQKDLKTKKIETLTEVEREEAILRLEAIRANYYADTDGLSIASSTSLKYFARAQERGFYPTSVITHEDLTTQTQDNKNDIIANISRYLEGKGNKEKIAFLVDEITNLEKQFPKYMVDKAGIEKILEGLDDADQVKILLTEYANLLCVLKTDVISVINRVANTTATQMDYVPDKEEGFTASLKKLVTLTTRAVRNTDRRGVAATDIYVVERAKMYLFEKDYAEALGVGKELEVLSAFDGCLSRWGVNFGELYLNLSEVFSGPGYEELFKAIQNEDLEGMMVQLKKVQDELNSKRKEKDYYQIDFVSPLKELFKEGEIASVGQRVEFSKLIARRRTAFNGKSNYFLSSRIDEKFLRTLLSHMNGEKDTFLKKTAGSFFSWLAEDVGWGGKIENAEFASKLSDVPWYLEKFLGRTDTNFAQNNGYWASLNIGFEDGNEKIGFPKDAVMKQIISWYLSFLDKNGTFDASLTAASMNACWREAKAVVGEYGTQSTGAYVNFLLATSATYKATETQKMVDIRENMTEVSVEKIEAFAKMIRLRYEEWGTEGIIKSLKPEAIIKMMEKGRSLKVEGNEKFNDSRSVEEVVLSLLLKAEISVNQKETKKEVYERFGQLQAEYEALKKEGKDTAAWLKEKAKWLAEVVKDEDLVLKTLNVLGVDPWDPRYNLLVSREITDKSSKRELPQNALYRLAACMQANDLDFIELKQNISTMPGVSWSLWANIGDGIADIFQTEVGEGIRYGEDLMNTMINDAIALALPNYSQPPDFKSDVSVYVPAEDGSCDLFSLYEPNLADKTWKGMKGGFNSFLAPFIPITSDDIARFKQAEGMGWEHFKRHVNWKLPGKVISKYVGLQLRFGVYMPLHIYWGLPIQFVRGQLSEGGGVGKTAAGMGALFAQMMLYRNWIGLWYRPVIQEAMERDYFEAWLNMIMINSFAWRGGWDSIGGKSLRPLANISQGLGKIPGLRGLAMYEHKGWIQNLFEYGRSPKGENTKWGQFLSSRYARNIGKSLKWGLDPFGTLEEMSYRPGSPQWAQKYAQWREKAMSATYKYAVKKFWKNIVWDKGMKRAVDYMGGERNPFSKTHKRMEFIKEQIAFKRGINKSQVRRAEVDEYYSYLKEKGQYLHEKKAVKAKTGVDSIFRPRVEIAFRYDEKAKKFKMHEGDIFATPDYEKSLAEVKSILDPQGTGKMLLKVGTKDEGIQTLKVTEVIFSTDAKYKGKVDYYLVKDPWMPISESKVTLIVGRDVKNITKEMIKIARDAPEAQFTPLRIKQPDWIDYKPTQISKMNYAKELGFIYERRNALEKAYRKKGTDLTGKKSAFWKNWNGEIKSSGDYYGFLWHAVQENAQSSRKGGYCISPDQFMAMMRTEVSADDPWRGRILHVDPSQGKTIIIGGSATRDILVGDANGKYDKIIILTTDDKLAEDGFKGDDTKKLYETLAKRTGKKVGFISQDTSEAMKKSIYRNSDIIYCSDTGIFDYLTHEYKIAPGQKWGLYVDEGDLWQIERALSLRQVQVPTGEEAVGKGKYAKGLRPIINKALEFWNNNGGYEERYFRRSSNGSYELTGEAIAEMKKTFGAKYEEACGRMMRAMAAVEWVYQHQLGMKVQFAVKGKGASSRVICVEEGHPMYSSRLEGEMHEMLEYLFKGKASLDKDGHLVLAKKKGARRVGAEMPSRTLSMGIKRYFCLFKKQVFLSGTAKDVAQGNYNLYGYKTEIIPATVKEVWVNREDIKTEAVKQRKLAEVRFLIQEYRKWAEVAGMKDIGGQSHIKIRSDLSVEELKMVMSELGRQMPGERFSVSLVEEKDVKVFANKGSCIQTMVGDYVDAASKSINPILVHAYTEQDAKLLTQMIKAEFKARGKGARGKIKIITAIENYTRLRTVNKVAGELNADTISSCIRRGVDIKIVAGAISEITVDNVTIRVGGAYDFIYDYETYRAYNQLRLRIGRYDDPAGHHKYWFVSGNKLLNTPIPEGAQYDKLRQKIQTLRQKVEIAAKKGQCYNLAARDFEGIIESLSQIKEEGYLRSIFETQFYNTEAGKIEKRFHDLADAVEDKDIGRTKKLIKQMGWSRIEAIVDYCTKEGTVDHKLLKGELENTFGRKFGNYDEIFKPTSPELTSPDTVKTVMKEMVSRWVDAEAKAQVAFLKTGRMRLQKTAADLQKILFFHEIDAQGKTAETTDRSRRTMVDERKGVDAQEKIRQDMDMTGKKLAEQIESRVLSEFLPRHTKKKLNIDLDAVEKAKKGKIDPKKFVIEEPAKKVVAPGPEVKEKVKVEEVPEKIKIEEVKVSKEPKVTVSVEEGAKIATKILSPHLAETVSADGKVTLEVNPKNVVAGTRRVLADSTGGFLVGFSMAIFDNVKRYRNSKGKEGFERGWFDRSVDSGVGTFLIGARDRMVEFVLSDLVRKTKIADPATLAARMAPGKFKFWTYMKKTTIDYYGKTFIFAGLIATGMMEGVARAMERYRHLLVSGDPYKERMFWDIVKIHAFKEGIANLGYEAVQIILPLLRKIPGLSYLLQYKWANMMLSVAGVRALSTYGEKFIQPFIQEVYDKWEKQKRYDQAGGEMLAPMTDAEMQSHQRLIDSIMIAPQTLHAAGKKYIVYKGYEFLTKKFVVKYLPKLLARMGVKVTGETVASFMSTYVAGPLTIVLLIDLASEIVQTVENAYDPERKSVSEYILTGKPMSMHKLALQAPFKEGEKLTFQLAKMLLERGYLKKAYRKIIEQAKKDPVYRYRQEYIDKYWEDVLDAIEREDIDSFKAGFFERGIGIGPLAYSIFPGGPGPKAHKKLGYGFGESKDKLVFRWIVEEAFRGYQSDLQVKGMDLPEFHRPGKRVQDRLRLAWQHQQYNNKKEVEKVSPGKLYGHYPFRVLVKGKEKVVNLNRQKFLAMGKYYASTAQYYTEFLIEKKGMKKAQAEEQAQKTIPALEKDPRLHHYPRDYKRYGYLRMPDLSDMPGNLYAEFKAYMQEKHVEAAKFIFASVYSWSMIEKLKAKEATTSAYYITMTDWSYSNNYEPYFGPSAAAVLQVEYRRAVLQKEASVIYKVNGKFAGKTAEEFVLTICQEALTEEEYKEMVQKLQLFFFANEIKDPSIKLKKGQKLYVPVGILDRYSQKTFAPYLGKGITVPNLDIIVGANRYKERYDRFRDFVFRPSLAAPLMRNFHYLGLLKIDTKYKGVQKKIVTLLEKGSPKDLQRYLSRVRAEHDTSFARYMYELYKVYQTYLIKRDEVPKEIYGRFDLRLNISLATLGGYYYQAGLIERKIKFLEDKISKESPDKVVKDRQILRARKQELAELRASEMGRVAKGYEKFLREKGFVSLTKEIDKEIEELNKKARRMAGIIKSQNPQWVTSWKPVDMRVHGEPMRFKVKP